MLKSLKQILGFGPSADYAQLIKQGAIILDVRTKAEYNRGHINGSLNIAVDQLNENLHRFPDKMTPVITCCASGIRSAAAKRVLESKGFSHVYNGGNWTSLNIKI